MVLTDLFEVRGMIRENKVEPHTRSDEYFFHPGKFTDPLEKLALEPVTGVKRWARRAAVPVRARPGLPPGTGKPVHVCCRASKVLNDSLELRHLCNPGRFAQD